MSNFTKVIFTLFFAFNAYLLVLVKDLSSICLLLHKENTELAKRVSVIDNDILDISYNNFKEALLDSKINELIHKEQYGEQK